MYPVSNDYLAEIAKNNPTTRITGTLTLKNSSVIQITNSVIAKAPTIINQCVNNSELKLGQAYQAQLDISIYSDINRYSVYGATMVLNFGLKIGSSWEDVPLGVFIVSECIRTSNDVLQLTLLDKMDKLDEKYTGVTISGSPYDILSFIASECGLVLAQSREEIETLPNGTHTFGMPEKYRSETWRDVVGDLAACLGGNVLVDRSGELYIQSFATSVTRTLPASARSKEKISDYLVAYSSVSCVKDSSVIAVGADTDQNLSLDDNDFVQLGTDDGIRMVLSNILAAINGLVYTPSDISWYGDPALDLGDLIEATGGAAADSTMIPLQKYKWTWRGEHQIIAVGKNPNLGEAKSLTDKKIEGLLQSTSQNEVTYHSFVNVEAITFGPEQEITIASLPFTSAQLTTVKIMHEFIFDMIADLAVGGSYEIRYYLDEELLAYKPYERLGAIQNLNEGDDTEFSIARDFIYILREVEPNVRHTWQVRIITHDVESTTIDVNHSHVILEGQRLYGDKYFDGYIEVKESFDSFAIKSLQVGEISDTADIDFIAAAVVEASDNFAEIFVKHIEVGGISDSVQVFMEGGFYIATEDGRIITTEDGRGIITE